MLKGRVYFNNPQTIEELEQNIRDAVAAISTDIDEAIWLAYFKIFNNV